MKQSYFLLLTLLTVVSILNGQESTLRTNFFAITGDNNAYTGIFANHSQNEFGVINLRQTNSPGVGSSTKLGLSANLNSGGLIWLKDATNTERCTLYGDYLSSTAVGSNHGHLYLSGSSTPPAPTPGADGPILDLIRLANTGTNREWDIGIYENKLNAAISLGTYISFQYENVTRAAIETDGDWLKISDRRFKKDIQSFDNVLPKILSLRPTHYEMKESPGRRKFGFIAQELEKIFPELVTHLNTKEEDHYLVNYIGLIPVLTQAIKEQQIYFEEQEKVLTQKDQKISALSDRLDKLENQMKTLLSDKKEETNQNVSIHERAFIQQNQPNPFNGTTKIHYTLPKHIQQAQLGVTTINGKVLHSFPLAKDQSFITLNASELSAGNYFYSLIIDGQIVDTKQMILMK